MEIREIKFRGKRIDNGEWVEGDLITKTPFGECIRSGTDHGYTVDPTTIGQYTGLKDKHGKEIYEGDVLKYNKKSGEGFGSKPKYKEGTVEFLHGEFCLRNEENNITFFAREIIGSIHDKELKE